MSWLCCCAFQVDVLASVLPCQYEQTPSLLRCASLLSLIAVHSHWEGTAYFNPCRLSYLVERKDRWALRSQKRAAGRWIKIHLSWNTTASMNEIYKRATWRTQRSRNRKREWVQPGPQKWRSMLHSFNWPKNLGEHKSEDSGCGLQQRQQLAQAQGSSREAASSMYLELAAALTSVSLKLTAKGGEKWQQERAMYLTRV